MGKQFNHINKDHIEFIIKQKIFFVATSTPTSRISLSPKGMDSFRVLSKNKIIWLNYTGSGNETAAHLNIDSRITIMFCAFEGAPMILRLYGKGKVIHKDHHKWQHHISQFKDTAGARQIIEIDIDLVQTSCGMSIPLFEYKEERHMLKEWASIKTDKELEEYWQKKNQFSIDGIPTNINKNYH